jgi:GR25 family glycosyltransferase involved in LPS biosynthesis
MKVGAVKSPLLCIFEDDVELHEQFSMSKVLSSAPSDFDVLQLGTNCPGELERLQRIRKNCKVHWVRWEAGFWGAFAYIITRKAARKLVRWYIDSMGRLALDKTMRPDSTVADIIIYADLKAYTSTWPMATNAPGFQSQIRSQSASNEKWVQKAREKTLLVWNEAN